MIKVSKAQSLFITSIFSLFFLVVFWLTLAPVQFGGPLTYTIVNGNSMEPSFFLGDLVLIRREAIYTVGDAVVYQDPNMQQFVFHRIADQQIDRFILKGDNNGWLDSYQPSSGEIVGKLWGHIPKFGKVIQWLRVPINASIATGMFGVLLMLDTIKKPPQNKRKLKAPAGTGASSQVTLMVYGTLTALFLAVGIFAFTRPVELPAANIPYQQTGDYSYSATGTSGVYDTDTVRAGEPIFPKLTCFLNVGYTYNLLGDQLQGGAGTYRMYARIMDAQSGWQRTVSLTPDTAFSGSSFFNISTLDLCQVEAIVNLVEAQAGLKQTSYTMEIVTDVTVAAYANSSPIQDTFSHAMVFKYDKIHFYLDENGGQTAPLFLEKFGTAGSTASQVNTISLVGLPLPIWVLRLFALLGFAICGLALASAGTALYQTASQSEEALIRLKYGAWLVNVHEQALLQSASVVDVSTIDDLARIAERNNSMILHMPRNFLHFYFVQSNGVTYRYVITEGRSSTVGEETAPTVEKIPERPVSAPVHVPEPQPEEKPMRIGNRLIFTYPPQKEIPGLDEVQIKTNQHQGITWATSNAPEYVVDEDDAYTAAPMDATLLYKLKL